MFLIDDECKKPPCKENESYNPDSKECTKCGDYMIHNDIGTQCECKGKNDGTHFFL